MNLSNSQDGLSSCQCTTTLYGEKEKTENYILRIPQFSQIMREDSRTGIDWSFLGPGSGKNGTEFIRTNRIENGIETLRT